MSVTSPIRSLTRNLARSHLYAQLNIQLPTNAGSYSQKIRKYSRNCTAFSDERQYAISLPNLTVGGGLPPRACSHQCPVHRRRPRRLSPPDATAISLEARCRFAALPPSPPFPDVPLRLVAFSSSSHPLCGPIPLRSASRRPAYVTCHTLCPCIPPHPNPAVCFSWSLSFPPRRAVNTCCRTFVAPRFC